MLFWGVLAPLTFNHIHNLKQAYNLVTDKGMLFWGVLAPLTFSPSLASWFKLKGDHEQCDIMGPIALRMTQVI